MAEMLAHFKIKLNGSDAPRQMRDDLAGLMVETNLHLPGMFTIRLLDRELRWADSDQLAVGTEVEIAAQAEGASSPTTLISGEITALEPEFTQARPVLQVRGYDRAHRLHRGRQRKVFVQTKDSDIASQIAGDAGLTPDVEPTSETYEYVLQNNLTNWEFLQERAQRNGFACYVQDGKLHFKSPSASGRPVELEWGLNLREFYPRLSSSAQVKEVVVRGWDPIAKQAIVGQSTQGDLEPEIGVSESDPGMGVSQSAFDLDAQMVVVDRPVHSQAEADAMARGIADDLTGDYIRADGEANGDPRLRAGTAVDVSGLGDRFSGQYVVTRAVHSHTAGKYMTQFAVTGRRPMSIGALLTGERAPQNGRQSGVVIGIVTDNEDPDAIGRVKVKFPWLADDAVSTWARVASPMAGADRGFYFLPEVNDEVLVAFEHDDINYPYVLGSLWNGQDKPPQGTAQVVGSGGQVNQRILQSRSGHLIILDDSSGSEQIIIRDKTGSNEIVIDSAQNSMSIKVDGDFTIEAKGKITLKSTQDMTLESQANGKFKSGTNLDLEAGANGKLKTGANLDLEAGAMGKFKAGATLSLEGSAMTEVKGAIVKIN